MKNIWIQKGTALTIAAVIALLPGLGVNAWENVSQEDGLSPFEDLQDVRFAFSSGVGGWGTLLRIEPDGSFSGEFHDSDMGVTGEDYPNGTLYLSQFNGVFSLPEKVDDYTYVFQIEQISLSEEEGTEEIRDGVKVIYSEPYGLENSENFYLFLPGSSLESLPEEYLDWIRFADMKDASDMFLSQYGLFNEAAGDGFSSYRETEGLSGSQSAQNAESQPGFIEQEIQTAILSGASLEEELNSGALNQTQLNLTSYDLYMIWDDALNNIWGYLKETLDSGTMEALTAEEIDWINRKEADIRAAGEPWTGGSGQPYIENTTAFRWTRDRVYELQRRYGSQPDFVPEGSPDEEGKMAAVG